MAETLYGVRSYTCSERTKRPQKNKADLEKLEKRNSSQKKLYITLENINQIFSNDQETFPICYDMIFNLIQGKVTKYFNTRSYDRKKELSYDCMCVLYSTLKRKLLRLKDQQGLLNPPPVLFFYLSQFFRYVDLVVFSVVYYGTQDIKHIVQEPENFQTENVLFENLDDTFNIDNFINRSELEEPTIDVDTDLNDNSENIKQSIENNKNLTDKEKNVLLKIYKNSYSDFGCFSLTKRDNEILSSIRQRIEMDPNLLKDLEDILNGQGKN